MDMLYSAQQKKIMSGGAGNDQFIWLSRDALQGGIDEITDFSVTEGDQLNLGSLLDNFDIQLDEVSDVVRLQDTGSFSVVEIFDGANWLQVVQLNGVTNTTAQDLWDSGSLLL
jgi:Ca2+-binding RTX toxin-like protein